MRQPDSLDVGTQMDVAKHRLQVAKEDLETAKLIFDVEKYRGANNRAYYSIFHTISAVLAIEGIAFKKHKDTLSYFNKNYYLYREGDSRNDGYLLFLLLH